MFDFLKRRPELPAPEPDPPEETLLPVPASAHRPADQSAGLEAMAFMAALAEFVSIPTRGAMPSGRWDVDALGDNSGKIGEYRNLYFRDSLVKAGVDNIAGQSVQMGPMVLTAGPGDGEAFDRIRPVATAPQVRLRDWLTDLATWYLVDGEIFIVADPTRSLGGDPLMRFRVLDPVKVRPIKRGDTLLGWEDGAGARFGHADILHLFDQKVPGQWRGVSVLQGAALPAQELAAARTAMDRAFQDYGRLPGYWRLPLSMNADLEAPPMSQTPETPEEKAAREKRNADRLATKLSLTAGQTPKVFGDTEYVAINRSGDAFANNYPDYWRSKTAEIARALSIPDYIVSGSVRDTNYSALRIAHMEAKSSYQGIQRMLECVIEWCYIRYMPGGSPIVEIRWPPQPVLDVQKEYYAIGSAITAGLMSPESAMRQIGLDYEQELERMESWVTEATRRGIPVSRPQFPPYPETEDSDG